MNYETHCFSVELATKLGFEQAILLQHFHYWHKANKDKESMHKDGRIWSYSSRRTMLQCFPYLTDQKIRTSISKLIEKGYLIVGNFNEDKFKKANWYSLTYEALELFDDVDDIDKTTKRLVKITNDGLNQPIDNNNKDNNIYIEKKNIKEKIEDRENAFKASVQEYATKYPQSMLNDFVRYWTEPNASKTKMRFEMQPTFEIGRRLVTWNNNNNKTRYNEPTSLFNQPKQKKSPWEELGMSEEIYKSTILGK